MWLRVFGTNDQQPEPAAMLEYLHRLGIEATGKFRGDDQGWFNAELTGDEVSIVLERYLVKEEDIRSALNSWAAWLETVEDNPNHGQLMQHVIGTTQLFTLELPTDLAPPWTTALGRFLAQETAGVYQVDQLGFFAPDGTLLLPEEGSS
jgi:hypothetical protein